jgi:hypothetical protein
MALHFGDPEAIFIAQPRRKVLPIKKLMQAAIVALASTTSVPGTRPNRYPLDAVKGIAGMANTSAAT